MEFAGVFGQPGLNEFLAKTYTRFGLHEKAISELKTSDNVELLNDYKIRASLISDIEIENLNK